MYILVCSLFKLLYVIRPLELHPAFKARTTSGPIPAARTYDSIETGTR